MANILETTNRRVGEMRCIPSTSITRSTESLLTVTRLFVLESTARKIDASVDVFEEHRKETTSMLVG